MTDRLRSLQIDHQLELGRLLDREIGRLSAAQYFDERPRPLPVDLSEARAIAYETALFGRLRPLVDGGQAQLREPLQHTRVIAAARNRKQRRR